MDSPLHYKILHGGIMAVRVRGFSPAEKTKVPRLIMSVEGMEKCGKTRMALTAPGPIALIDMDIGTEGVVDQFVDEKEIISVEFDYRDATNHEEWRVMWDKVKIAHMDALATKDIRTIVWDTATEMWELVRLARFGKLTQIMPHHYGPVNAEYRDMIRKAYSTDKNLIMLHKMKSEYVNEKRTGKMERAGFGDAGYMSQINIRLWRSEEGEFKATILDCRQNAGANGVELEGNMIDFPTIAGIVFPEVSDDHWK